MSTQPVAEFLDRSSRDPMLRRFADALAEAVSLGTQLWSWAQDAVQSLAPDVGEGKVPLVCFYRHALELCDAVSELVRVSSIQPCQPLLRGMFEAWLGLAYILQADPDRRAKCYTLCHLREEVRLLQELDPNEQRGKQLLAKWKKCSASASPPFSVPADLGSMIKNHQTILAGSQYGPIEQEYQRLQSCRKGRVQWYSLFGGPCSIAEMATRLDQAATAASCFGLIYDVLYREWSQVVHGTGALRALGSPSSTSWRLRNAEDAQRVTVTAINMMRELGQCVVDALVPERKGIFTQWYDSEIKPLLDGPRGWSATL